MSCSDVLAETRIRVVNNSISCYPSNSSTEADGRFGPNSSTNAIINDYNRNSLYIFMEEKKKRRKNDVLLSVVRLSAAVAY